MSQSWGRVAQVLFLGVILGIIALESQRPPSAPENAQYSGNPLLVGNWITCSGQQVDTAVNCDVTSGARRHVGRFLASADAHRLLYGRHAGDVREARLWNAIQDTLAGYLLSGAHVVTSEKSYLVPINARAWNLAASDSSDGQASSEIVAIGLCLEMLENGNLAGVMQQALHLPERDLRAEVSAYLASARPGAKLDDDVTAVEAGHLGPKWPDAEPPANAYINARILDADGSRRWLGLIGGCWGAFMPAKVP